jgi:hypothetical protein
MVKSRISETKNNENEDLGSCLTSKELSIMNFFLQNSHTMLCSQSLLCVWQHIHLKILKSNAITAHETILLVIFPSRWTHENAGKGSLF